MITQRFFIACCNVITLTHSVNQGIAGAIQGGSLIECPMYSSTTLLLSAQALMDYVPSTHFALYVWVTLSFENIVTDSFQTPVKEQDCIPNDTLFPI